jgi:hypothetical protein
VFFIRVGTNPPIKSLFIPHSPNHRQPHGFASSLEQQQKELSRCSITWGSATWCRVYWQRGWPAESTNRWACGFGRASICGPLRTWASSVSLDFLLSFNSAIFNLLFLGFVVLLKFTAISWNWDQISLLLGSQCWILWDFRFGIRQFCFLLLVFGCCHKREKGAEVSSFFVLLEPKRGEIKGSGWDVPLGCTWFIWTISRTLGRLTKTELMALFSSPFLWTDLVYGI